MTDLFESTKPETLTRFIGKHFIYTYDNGWQYEMYLKNARTIDYRIHNGMVGRRWARDQDAQHPDKTVCFQNEHLDLTRQYRDAGPTYPKLVIDEFAPVAFIEDCGSDNPTVVDCAPDKLPADYVNRRS